MEAESTTEEQEAGDNRSCVRDSIVEEASDLIMVEDIVSIPFNMQTTYDFFNDIIIPSHRHGRCMIVLMGLKVCKHMCCREDIIERNHKGHRRERIIK